jgi:hypothetical protein
VPATPKRPSQAASSSHGRREPAPAGAELKPMSPFTPSGPAPSSAGSRKGASVTSAPAAVVAPPAAKSARTRTGAAAPAPPVAAPSDSKKLPLADVRHAAAVQSSIDLKQSLLDAPAEFEESIDMWTYQDVMADLMNATNDAHKVCYEIFPG